MTSTPECNVISKVLLLSQEEQMYLDRLKKPVVTFEEIQKDMDEKAKEFGYENHNDLLTKTGWFNRFDTPTV